ncbi:hypothetical protein DC522_33280, partial [Microvirga sp. KLBC 81]|uniref:UDP binding domain-containing protein n=1 Tax=Microvirga sp. KLBC 81 TaxID=1862707 RepID=UPI000D512EF9
AYGCAQGADALVIVTEWDMFRALDLGRIRKEMSQPVLVDMRNIYNLDEAVRHGFRYLGVGAPGWRTPKSGSTQASRDRHGK